MDNHVEEHDSNCEQVELQMLREFYVAWKALHAIPRNQQVSLQLAAQRLVELSDDIEALRSAH